MYTGGEVDQTMARALGLDDVRGVIVGRVEEGGPADKAGLQQQDVIVSLNGEQIRNWDAFRTEIASKKPGDRIDLGVIRDMDEVELTVTLGERPENEMATADPVQMESMEERLGFTVTGLDNSIREQLQLDSDTEGVVVRNINEGSAAYERGLRRGDVITRVKRIAVTSSAEFYDEVENAIEDGDEVLLLTVLRNDIEQFVAFEL